MARVLCASRVEYTLKIKKIVCGGTRSGAPFGWSPPPGVGGQARQAGRLARPSGRVMPVIHRPNAKFHGFCPQRVAILLGAGHLACITCA